MTDATDVSIGSIDLGQTPPTAPERCLPIFDIRQGGGLRTLLAHKKGPE
jgi:hypothetical protein